MKNEHFPITRWGKNRICSITATTADIITCKGGQTRWAFFRNENFQVSDFQKKMKNNGPKVQKLNCTLLFAIIPNVHLSSETNPDPLLGVLLTWSKSTWKFLIFPHSTGMHNSKNKTKIDEHLNETKTAKVGITVRPGALGHLLESYLLFLKLLFDISRCYLG